MVSCKMTADVDHISSALCLLGCHISAGKPRRGGSEFLPSETELCGLRHREKRSLARQERSTQHLQHGPRSGRGRLPGVCASQLHLPQRCQPIIAQGIPVGPPALHHRQPQRAQGPAALVSVSIRCCCPKATTLRPLATVDDSALGT